MNNRGLQDKGHPNLQLPVTPSITKRKQVQQSNTFRSPTDNMISPCSLKLLKSRIQNDLRDQSIGKNQFPKCDIDGKENEVS
ncbi:uncharacterized protein ACMZJ9_004180 [Mantella aurantiaca]